MGVFVSVEGEDALENATLPIICPNRSLRLDGCTDVLPSQLPSNASQSRIMIVTALAATLCACSIVKSSRTVDETKTLSPRVIRVGDPVPKGGGFYKLGKPYLAGGKWYTPVADQSYDRVGFASWYGDFFHGRRTANGEVYDMNALTAAHPTLPMPGYAAVTNLANNRTVVVRINDRGPYADDRIIDLSHKAAELLGFFGRGIAAVRVRYLGLAPLDGDDRYEKAMLAKQPWATHLASNPQRRQSARSDMLAAAVWTAEKPLVTRKGAFEGRRVPKTGAWNTAAITTLRTGPILTAGR